MVRKLQKLRRRTIQKLLQDEMAPKNIQNNILQNLKYCLKLAKLQVLFN